MALKRAGAAQRWPWYGCEHCPTRPFLGPTGTKLARQHPQRRRRFHEQPANAPSFTTTRPHVARHETHSTNARRLTLAPETHNTNARRLTLAPETHNTNARLQPPKTGPLAPAKATPVSPPPPNTPAKATPVSRTAGERTRFHHHKAPNSHHRCLSTGVMLNARYPQGPNSSFSSCSRGAIIHQSGPYPQLHMVVSNCYLNSSHPSDHRFSLLAFMERKCSYIASERTATF